jgi:hypothetical protein
MGLLIGVSSQRERGGFAVQKDDLVDAAIYLLSPEVRIVQFGNRPLWARQSSLLMAVGWIAEA